MLGFNSSPILWDAFGEYQSRKVVERSGYRKRRRRWGVPGFGIPPYLRELFRDPLKRRNGSAISRVDVLDRNKIPIKLFKDLEEKLIGRQLSRQEVLYELEPIVEWCKSQGYSQSGVVVESLPSAKDSRLILKCVEPVLSGVRLVVLDNENLPDPGIKPRTKASTIAHVLGMNVGDTFRWNKRGFDLLAASGIVDFATVELEIISPNLVEAVVYLRERRSGHFEPGIAITSDGKIEADVSLMDNNFRGLGQRLRAVWKRRIDIGKMSGGIEFDDPRVGSTVPLSYKFRLYRDAGSDRMLRVHEGRTTQEHIHSLAATAPERDRNGVLFDVKYQPSPFSMVSAGPVIEKILSEGNRREESQALFALTAKHDNTRPYVAPHAGHNARLEYNIGVRLTGRSFTKTPFQKCLLYLSQYFDVGKLGSLAVRAQIGLGSDNLPYWEQTILGGARTVRGFCYGELGRAGNYTAGRVELRVPFGTSAPALKKDKGNVLDRLPSLVGVIFGDVATILEPFDVHSASSIGLGLRIGGLLNLEYTLGSHGREPLLHFGLLHREF